MQLAFDFDDIAPAYIQCVNGTDVHLMNGVTGLCQRCDLVLLHTIARAA